MIRRSFSSSVSIGQLVTICDAVSAHVSAKLQHFGSDERTLTDELVDMFWLWAAHTRPESGATLFDLRIEKFAWPEESHYGADLEFVLSTPAGFKRVLAQAEVLDPDSLKPGCKDSQAWEHFRLQLRKVREHAGLLGVAMLYCPAAELRAAPISIGTWEQCTATWSPGRRAPRLGVTLIPADSLIAKRICRWNYHGRLTYVAGKFAPEGVSFTQFILELITCRRGQWVSRSTYSPTSDAEAPAARLVLSASIAEENPAVWNAVVEHASTILGSLRDDFDNPPAA